MVGGGGGESSHFPNITEEQNMRRMQEMNGQVTQGFTSGPGTRPVDTGEEVFRQGHIQLPVVTGG